eukprot:jgi/Mesvir1/28576/Mv00991-RA.1
MASALLGSASATFTSACSLSKRSTAKSWQISPCQAPESRGFLAGSPLRGNGTCLLPQRSSRGRTMSGKGYGARAETPAHEYKVPPKTFYTKKGESCLFQFGESLRIEEVPEGTRVIYPGVRKDGERNPQKVREMILKAFNEPEGTPPLREKLRALKASKENPKVLFAFDDVSIPLPPMVLPDIRGTIMELAEEMCIEEGITDIEFVCSIALHRYIRKDEFRHICGRKLFDKYYPSGRMRNYNAVDDTESTHIGYTRHGEDVKVCSAMANADLMIYANVNYVSMDGGYKSYATGMVHYDSLRHNHDSKTLRATRSLYDPKGSAMHKSFERMGKMIAAQTDIFHVETVLDENLFPWYLRWCLVLKREMNLFQRMLCTITVMALKIIPLWLRMRVFWSFIVRGPFGLLQVKAGETRAVHEHTLALNYKHKVVDVDGQADILIVAPSCLGPYTKDTYLNPLLVNTYALGYYYNMYIDGTPLLKEGGALIVVNPMPYAWSSPAHDGYRQFFEEVVAKSPGLDEFEAHQQRFATNDKLNDIYRKGLGPAGVHGFYMYTWAAHGMDKTGKVYVVGAKDPRGPNILRWTMKDSIMEAVEDAKKFLNNPNANVTYWNCPPIGYARVKAAPA